MLLQVLTVPAFAEVEVEDYDYYQRFRGQGISINVHNWGEYISNDAEESIDVNAEFEELTGIKVNYTTFASNEELYARLKSGGASYDVIIPSDYMIARFIREDMLEELNLDNIPNAKFTNPEFMGMEYDPDDKYSIPYTWGTVGIIYNTTMVDNDITSWDSLWDARYLGDILMFSNPRDAFGIAQKRLGYSLNTHDLEELRDAADELKAQKSLVQAYVMDEIFDKMEGGEAALAPYYAGDAITMMDENPDLAFVVPQEGTNKFVDSICIPKGSKQKEAAEMYINFLCEPEVAAANIEYIGYSTPNLAAYELLDEETQNNPVIYPPAEIMAKAEFFYDLPPEVSAEMDALWVEVISAEVGYSKWTIPILILGCIVLSIGINVVRSVKKKRDIY
ncbi:spermidine/putrescine ABC transporter substrate-binding protein [Clostridiaceae bacterium NSJ-31]|uniref:Spermidine/putrescine ABC transporter substrate-binding protein n=2 Tax=Ligaoa zhengdingensis TaxID=2763658 RepID=A0A926DWY7_9FIRM|nr:spermidine/putrescine ABC transporter substrate-binding protein [Ligaoa zhengdingensis]MBC8545621.1 spermidine/putrescine ABC transporter substrate-binding protein [Ligaoa zhengdingensis]